MTVIDLEQIVRGEYDENVERMGFQPTEMNAIRKAYQIIEKAAAKLRQLAGLKRGADGPVREIFPDGEEPKKEDRVRDRIGAFCGVSGRTMEKIAEGVRRGAQRAGAVRRPHLVSDRLRPLGDVSRIVLFQVNGRDIVPGLPTWLTSKMDGLGWRPAIRRLP